MNKLTGLFDVDIVVPRTLAEVVALIERVPMAATRRRDLVSGVKRFCAVTRQSPSHARTDVSHIRQALGTLNPAAHGLSGKTFANIVANLKAALAVAGVIDAVRSGTWKQQAGWLALLERRDLTRRLRFGLAHFANYCASEDIGPDAVCDRTVLKYHEWLLTRTIEEDPSARTRSVPRYVNEAREEFGDWPMQHLAAVIIGLKPAKTTWADLPASFRLDAETWLLSRRNPDPFDDAIDRPAQAIAPNTERLHRQHIRLAWHILNECDLAPADLTELVEADRFKAVLRHYHDEAGGKPNAFAETTAAIVKSIARYHVRSGAEDLGRLKRIAGRMPTVPHDLTDKNKELLRAFEDDDKIARLLGLPDILMREALRRLERGERYPERPAQTAIAIAILTAAPMRCQNLIGLDGRIHILETGKSASMRVFIPKSETKSKRQDLIFNLDDATAGLIRRYRTKILPSLAADPNGPLFVTRSGGLLAQSTLANNITKAIQTDVGIHMTPHQFRHLAAALYLNSHPEDFETVRQLLGHAWGKTTLVYAGLSGERASKAYQNVVLEEHDRLRLKGRAALSKRKHKPKGKL